MTDDMQPCPFCGATETTILNGPVEDDWCAVSCDKCYAGGPHNYTDPHAISGWNRRAMPADLAATLAANAALVQRLEDAREALSQDPWNVGYTAWMNKRRAFLAGGAA